MTARPQPSRAEQIIRGVCIITAAVVGIMLLALAVVDSTR